MASLTTLVLAIDARQAAVGGNQFVAVTNNIKIGAARAATANKTLGGSFGTLAKQMGKAFLVFKALQGIKGTTRTIADFEETMKTVELVTRSATAQMEQMTEVARVLGATTRYTANEAAEGMLQLARAGFSAEESMRAIKDSLDLATAGGLTLAESTQYMANSIRQFALDASDAGRVANVFTVISNNANMTVRDMAESMKYAGTVAASTGVSIEETAAAMGVLADRGIRGTRAGTQFRGVLLALAGPTKRMHDALGKLAVRYEEVNPATHSLTEIMDRLRLGVDGLANPMDKAGLYASIFTRRQVAAGLALTEMNGHLKDQIQITKDLTGEHTRMARELEQTVKGKWIAFQSALQEVALDAGDGGVKGILHGLLDVLVETTRIVGDVASAWEKAGSVAKILATAVHQAAIAYAALMALKILSFFWSMGTAIWATVAATGSLTAATHGLRAAIAGTGIGLFVVALGSIASWYLMNQDRGENFTRTLEEQDKKAKALGVTLRGLTESHGGDQGADKTRLRLELLKQLRGELAGATVSYEDLKAARLLGAKETVATEESILATLDAQIVAYSRLLAGQNVQKYGTSDPASALAIEELLILLDEESASLGIVGRTAADTAIKQEAYTEGVKALAKAIGEGAIPTERMLEHIEEELRKRDALLAAIQEQIDLEKQQASNRDYLQKLEDEVYLLKVLAEQGKLARAEAEATLDMVARGIPLWSAEADRIYALVKAKHDLTEATKGSTGATVESTRAIESWIRSGNEQLAVMEKQKGLSGVFGPEYENAMKKAAISAEASARIASMNKDKMAPEKYTEMVAKIKEMELALLGEVDAMTLLAEKREYAENAAQAFTNAFGSIISGANSAKDAVKGLIEALIQMALQKSLLGPMQDALSGMFMGLGGAAAGGGGGGWDTGTQGGLGGGGGGWVARGGVMENGNLTRYAYGGVVDSPMYFPTRSGTGLMAEAGSPEAIMPLKRGKDGKLGVASDGGGGGPRVVNVSMNVQTKDADSFRRSRVQIQSDLKRMTTNMGLS
jgi:TP901 family phage tail tape measure protein